MCEYANRISVLPCVWRPFHGVVRRCIHRLGCLCARSRYREGEVESHCGDVHGDGHDEFRCTVVSMLSEGFSGESLLQTVWLMRCGTIWDMGSFVAKLSLRWCAVKLSAFCVYQ